MTETIDVEHVVPEPLPGERTDAFLPGDWFCEFAQDYGDGIRVTKRGLEATNLIIRKYAVAPDEVLAFSTFCSPRRAMTAFHFHPDFDPERRRLYMEAHREGYDVAVDVTAHLAAERAGQRAAILRRLGRARRGVSLLAHAAAVFILAHYSSGR